MRRADALPALAALAALCGACATKDGAPDPLKNSRKLIVPAHVSLYKNGAFRVPNTTITVIPPGPSALRLALELAGVRARQSLQKSLEQAAQSVYIVSEGSKLTFRVADGVRDAGDADADFLKKRVRDDGVVLVYRSSALGKRIAGKSWGAAKANLAAAPATGAAVNAAAGAAAEPLSGAAAQGAALAEDSARKAGDVARAGARDSGDALRYGLERFTRGYAAVPAEMKNRSRELGEQISSPGFTQALRFTNEVRGVSSEGAVDLMAETARGYRAGVAKDFSNAGREFDGAYQTTGVSLAALKSMRWVLQGLLADAVVVPAAKMTAASLGYVGVNMVAYPTMVVVLGGLAATELAVEVNWDAARSVYEITAPSGIAAVASIYALLDRAGSLAEAGAVAGGGAAAGYGEEALAKAGGVVVKGAGEAAGAGVRYIGVPLASAGIVLGGGTVGTVVGAAGAASGGALAVGGETAALSSSGFGRVLAGTTFVGGHAASVGAAGGYAAYELSQAVVVPPGYELAGGIVLDYGTMSQFGAQTILAASDCAYLVLSLEGPRWVLYAVKGNLGRGDDLPPGAVLDLRKMHEAGEEILMIPASGEELRGAVDALYDDLPALRSGPNRR